jgi:hypothetical protein
MIWMLAALVGVFFIFHDMLFGRYPPREVLDWMMLTMAAACFSIVPLGVGAGIAAIIGLAFKTKPIVVSRKTLITIRDKDGVSGRFFLGSGMVEGDQYYFYYAKNDDGSVSPGRVRADGRVRVYEEDREDAQLVNWEWELVAPWAYLVAFPVTGDKWSCDFHVPKGTVRTGFTM